MNKAHSSMRLALIGSVGIAYRYKGANPSLNIKA